jgi:hypothetical protein
MGAAMRRGIPTFSLYPRYALVVDSVGIARDGRASTVASIPPWKLTSALAHSLEAQWLEAVTRGFVVESA